MIVLPAMRRVLMASLLLLALPAGFGCDAGGGGTHGVADALDAPDAADAPAGDTVDDTAQPDVGPVCPGGLSCPCTLFTDCNTGLCVETIERFQCAYQCGMGQICPRAWGCTPISPPPCRP